MRLSYIWRLRYIHELVRMVQLVYTHGTVYHVYNADNQIPYSGYNLRGAISANHQISYLEVIFTIIKFANHSVTFCVAR